MKPLLIVRPEPGGSATVRRACALGLEPEHYPLFTIAPLTWAPPPAETFDALLLTSANAVAHAGPGMARYRALPTYVVGTRTATDLEGFRSIVAGTGSGADIAHRMAADGHRAILHLTGTATAPIDTPGLNITRIAVYEARESGDATGLGMLLTPGMVAMVHSPRAGQRLSALIPAQARGGLHLVAISMAALAASGEGWASGCAPPQPGDEAMLALALRLCE